MSFLHQVFDLHAGDIIEVNFDHPANVQLMDEESYRDYSAGKTFHYHGGYARNSPFRIKAPREGQWHLVVDLGGGAGSVRATARVLSSSAST